MKQSTKLSSFCRWRCDRLAHVSQFDPVFRRPITAGYDALPIGNGDLAAVLWHPEHLTLMLNKCDISGEASQAARLVLETPRPLTARAGRLETRLSLAEATATVRYTGGEFGTYRVPGDGQGAPTPESSGVWRGVYGPYPKLNPTDLGTVDVSTWIPHGRNVLLLDYAETMPEPHPLKIVLERWVQPRWGDKVRATVKGNLLTLFYAMNNGRSFAVVLAHAGFAGAALVKEAPLRLVLNVPAAASINGRLAVAVVTSEDAADPVAAAEQLARQTLAVDPKKLRTAQCAAWRRFWERFHVDAGHPYADALYHMAFYELGITSLGRRPVKFNGALNLWNERERTWNEGYTFHNQHSTYAPVYAGNHAELADNFHDWLARVRGETGKAAAELFGIDGAYFPEYLSHDFTAASARGWTGPNKEFELAYIVSTGVRACLLLWDRYRYTLDTAFLRTKAYPVIRDVAEFYVNYGKLGEDGLYHVEPSLSWEERPLGRDGHADCAAWRAIFAMVLAAADTLGVDTGRRRIWQERLRHAPPYPLDNGRFSVVMRRDGTPEPTAHFQWQLPNLSSVYPYGVIGIESPRPLRQLAEATFDRYRYNADAGHEYLPVIAARLGRADWWRGALYLFQQFFQNFDQGLFNYYSMVGNKDDRLQLRWDMAELQ